MNKEIYQGILKLFRRLDSLNDKCRNWGSFDDDYWDFESVLLKVHNEIADQAHLNNAKMIALNKFKKKELEEVRPSCRSLAEANRKVDYITLDQETPLLINESLLRSMEKKVHQYNKYSKFLSSYYFRESQGILRNA